MLRKAEEQRWIQGILSCRGGVNISHLLFANDNLLFYQTKVKECRELLNILDSYEAASGQAINRGKTTLFFSKNTRTGVKQDIQAMLGAQVFNDCEQYLGLPMVVGKSKVNTFKGVREKIAKRVTGWKERLISKVGREILIKIVAQVIPTNTMSIFRLPKHLCDDINFILALYWWGQMPDEKKVHWISWKRLCNPKNLGGMGFCDLHAFNLAMLAKQAWRMLHHIKSLFYWIYKARYFPDKLFLEAEIGHNPSHV